MGKPSDGVDPSSDTLVATDPAPPQQLARGARLSIAGYEVGDALGEGGMGEVLLARDTKIGRDVAIKRMRHADPSPDSIERFLREAKIQARLDHPAIVPVHELGEDAQGRPYFTMKRLAGTTLADKLGDGTSIQELLRAFVDVCLAVELAHSRGVVHRDLKPSNIICGDYGEVYVLDWGVARVVGEGAEANRGDITTLEGHTQVGALLGTPGYMAPEQARGEDVGPAADVYALGSILFEILAGDPLHPRGTQNAIQSTLARPSQAPAVRSPDRAIAPELDGACTAALAEDPAKRPSARELADRVQRYLDGDRDVERRRVLAADELAAAQQAVRDPTGRAEAIRRAGRALVLDPESRDAATFVVQMLLEPPKELPAALQREIELRNVELAASAARSAAFAMSSYFVFIPFVIWMGIRQWPVFIAIYALITLMGAFAWYQSKSRRVSPMLPLILNAAIMILLSRVLSPFMFVPTVVCVFTVTLTTEMRMWERPWIVGFFALLAFLLPFVLELTGVFDRTWAFEGGRLVIQSAVVDMNPVPTLVLLLLGNVGAIVTSLMFARTMGYSRDRAHQSVEIQAWHLKQMLPVETPRPALEGDLCALIRR